MSATTLRHEPTDDCNGRPSGSAIRKNGQIMIAPYICPECLAHLCPCEAATGHDCEDNR